MEQESYRQGELVPVPGKYRCSGSGEVWTVGEKNVRFPPCEVCKDGNCRWHLVEQHG